MVEVMIMCFIELVLCGNLPGNKAQQTLENSVM